MDANAIPGYVIKRKLGAGAMAAVYLAKDKKLDRNVALKIMSERLLGDKSFAERFVREAKIVASISHQNIVTVFDVGSHGDYHYMAMELLPGGDLSSKLKEGLQLDQAIKIIKEIAEGLHYAASKNFIHRDIKPDNIMFAEDGRAVITDFGIARNTDSETNMTMVGSIIGTPQYMSPEQAGAKKLDHRTDLYSLGIILFEILTGKPPFKGDSAISTGVMHITQPVPVLPADFKKFQGFINKALAKNPDERFQSGKEFITALDNIDLDSSDDIEAETIVMSIEDLDEVLGSSKPQSDIFPISKASDAISILSSEAGAFKVEDSGTNAKILPITFALVGTLFISLVISHIYYVNILNKRVNVVPMAKALVSFSSKNFGIRLDLKEPVLWIHRTSRNFGEVTGKVFGGFTESSSEELYLSPKQQELVTLMEAAMKEQRLYSPHFDCAESYLKELQNLYPDDRVVSLQAEQLLSLSLDLALASLSEDIERADMLIQESERILPLVKNPDLLIRHRQVASTVIISR